MRSRHELDNQCLFRQEPNSQAVPPTDGIWQRVGAGRPERVTTVTLPSGPAADVSSMGVAANLDDRGFRVSPELVLVDAGLSAEVRHLLVVPEDTLERLERDGDRRRRATQEVVPPAEPDDFGLTRHENTESSEDDVAPQERGQYSTASDAETAAAPEPDDLIQRQDVASAGHVIEYVTPDESPQGPSNTYPVLPAPPPEYSQEDATDTVLRMITKSA